MIHVADDPRTFVSLSRVSGLVTEFFDLETDETPTYDSPFMWWSRSKQNIGIAVPMPEPVAFGAANGRAPLWYQEQIIHWYGEWRELEVPECREAGDRISNRGVMVLSSYRVA